MLFCEFSGEKDNVIENLESFKASQVNHGGSRQSGVTPWEANRSEEVSVVAEDPRIVKP